MDELGNSGNGRVVLCAVCLLLAVTLGCSSSQAGSPEFRPTEPRVQSSVAATSPIQTPAQVSPFTATTRVYYVATNEPNASDSNNGLRPTYQGGQDGPWLTIHHAANVMTAGDTSYVRAGTYYESGIFFAHPGAPEAPITLSNYESEGVFIDGSRAADDYAGIGIVEGCGHYVIQGFTIRNMGGSGIATDGSPREPYKDITIRHCILHNNGWSGIELAAVDRFVVENVEAYDNGYYGLNIVASEDGAFPAANGIVRHSSFHGHMGHEGHGLAINQGHHITVSDSVAYHNTVHGFDVSDWPKHGELSHHITLERNSSYDNGVAGFAINSDSHHVVYRNNAAWQNGADWAGQGSSSGFWCYEGCWHVEWYNNVAVENTDAGFMVEDQLGMYATPEDNLLIFKNNVAYNNGRPHWEETPALVVKGTGWQVVATHNNWGGARGLNTVVVAIHLANDEGEIYAADEINNGDFQIGNVSVDPGFVDMESADWRLRPGSRMIDVGTDVGMPFCGAAPDIGAIESCP